MYAFHEAPKEGRDRILQEAHRLLEPGGTLAVVDTHSDFKPNMSMLSGEPYGRYTLSLLLFSGTVWIGQLIVLTLSTNATTSLTNVAVFCSSSSYYYYF